MDDTIKKLIDVAIGYGRKKTSAQTGYIHCCYYSLPEEVQYPVPVLENVLFALALFRTRTVENMTEGKTIIEKLLSFQNKVAGHSFGNFPLYLHDYPHCKDWHAGVHLLAPFYWILCQFHQALGHELKARLEKAVNDLMDHCKTLVELKGAPPYIEIKVAAAEAAFGKLFHWADMQHKGEKSLEQFAEPSKMWYEPKHLGDMLIALQMAHVEFDHPVWKPFWRHLSHTWNPNVCSYAGPAVADLQEGFEPQPTLYDLFMGYLHQSYSKRALSDHTYHLHAALIHPFSVKPEEVVQEKAYSCVLLDQKELYNASEDKGTYPFKLLWGNSQRVHSFVCQGSNSRKVECVKTENGAELLFHLAEEMQLEEKEKCREIPFYLDLFDGAKIQVEGSASTVFKLGETVGVEMERLKFSIRFELVEQSAKGIGSSQFIGHIMRGNRPSQTMVRGENRFAAYDWQIFLRTLRRDEKCTVRAIIEITEKE